VTAAVVDRASRDPARLIDAVPPRVLEAVTLQGRVARLEPMCVEHVDRLWCAGAYPKLWELTASRVRDRSEMQRYVDEALAAAETGAALPFVTTLHATGEIVGSTRFAAYERAHARVEIGWSWVTPAHQRTAVNTEAKLLMFD